MAIDLIQYQTKRKANVMKKKIKAIAASVILAANATTQAAEVITLNIEHIKQLSRQAKTEDNIFFYVDRLAEVLKSLNANIVKRIDNIGLEEYRLLKTLSLLLDFGRDLVLDRYTQEINQTYRSQFMQFSSNLNLFLNYMQRMKNRLDDLELSQAVAFNFDLERMDQHLKAEAVTLPNSITTESGIKEWLNSKLVLGSY